ncbi:hypothetical protein [Actinomadura madurae]|uniref:hypothetical protein n=1 Tax=Actinomadura madurae TaxID=1993 RepID=UPI0020D22F8E|nr:hypothetical protein [Actinomadura madurae]MCQ0013141.1 hypothetical protein [Actinomadura madurae]
MLLIGVVVPPLYYPLGYPDGPVGAVLWVALFTAAVECRLLVSLGAVIVVNAEFLTVAVTRGGGGDPDAIVDARGVASLSIGLLLAVGLGQYVRSRREMAEAALRRAAGPSGTARRRRGAARSPSGCGSRGSCTTCWRTRSR